MADCKILLLDDDEETQQLVRATLAERGYNVCVARRISEARSLLDNTRFDLMVVDGLLPDGNGVEFIAECRDREGCEKVVFISSFYRGLDHYRHLTNDLGVSQVVSKPFSPNELLVQIDAILSRSTVAPPSRDPHDAALHEKLATLHSAYAEALPGKIHTLAEAVAEAHISGNIDALQKAHDLVHRTHGTAGSYGFPELGAVAGKLERQLQRGLQQHQPMEVDWGSVSDRVAELRRLLEVSQPKQVEEKSESTADSASEPPSATVLVVDDDEDFLAHVKHLGEQSMVRVVTACTVARAISLARTHHLDAALIDVSLGNGERAEDVAGALRLIERQRSLPLAFVSADTGLENRISAVDAGASLFLDKPLAREAFVEAINQLRVDRDERRPRILIVDDNSDSTEMLSLLLQDHGYETHTINDPTGIVDAIEQFRPDLLLLDLVMPKLSGFDICKMVRANPSWQMPLMVMSTDKAPQVRVASYAAGADDYLAKPIIEEELFVRIQLRLEQARQSRDRAERDPLTGLLTRRAFIQALPSRISEVKRRGVDLALCLLDLDHFKSINDTYGHLAGDRVLAHLGRMLSMRFRASDLRCRWGGEEFVIVFVGENAAAATEILDRVRSEFQQVAFTGDNGVSFTASFSAGISSLPNDGETGDELLRAADKQLYDAKRGGRGRTHTSQHRTVY